MASDRTRCAGTATARRDSFPCARLLRAAVGFALISANEPQLRLLHRWLDTWSGVGDVVAGMARQEYDLEDRLLGVLGLHSAGPLRLTPEERDQLAHRVATALLSIHVEAAETARREEVAARRAAPTVPLRFEDLPVRLSRTFVHLPSHKVETAFERSLQQLGQFLELPRYNGRGWRAIFFQSGFEHSLTSHAGSAWAREPLGGGAEGGRRCAAQARGRRACAARLDADG